MTTHPADPVHQAQRDLAAWHSRHPDATFAEIEAAVEEQIERVRAQLLEERTEAGVREEHPVCRQCGTTMEPRATTKRTLLLRGDEPLELERSYVVCPSCGAGLFPPG
jgi:YgiT-type zinc finger domain-containing protein